MSITIRYFAAAKAAVGRGHEHYEIPDATHSTIADILTAVAATTPDPGATATVLARCSFLHNHRATTDPTTALGPDDTLDILPPFAGG